MPCAPSVWRRVATSAPTRGRRWTPSHAHPIPGHKPSQREDSYVRLVPAADGRGDPSMAVGLDRPLCRRADAAGDRAAAARPLAHRVLRAAARLLFLPIGVAAGRADVRAELGLVFADDAITVAAR